MTNSQEKIGGFIKELRERKGLTQAEFARILDTSQSNIARLEGGNQNLTTAQLEKISEALNRQVISVGDGSLDLKIEGGNKLSGSVTTNTSKNGAVALLCASLVNHGTTIINDVPRIEEVFRIIEIFKSIDVDVKWRDERTLVINRPESIKVDEIDREAASQVRSVLMMIGSLSHGRDSFPIPHAGGCKMGERTISAHRLALELLGIEITTTENDYQVQAKNLHPAKEEVVMYEASDTATINALLAAAGTEGETTLSFTTPNYQVQDVCVFLQKLGIEIDGVGTANLTVRGKTKIDQEVECWVSEDPIESMLFLSAALTTGSALEITRCPIDFLKLEIMKLRQMGAEIETSDVYLAENDHTKLVDIKTTPSELTALDVKIHALPYPGINTDNLPFFVPIATQAEGTTKILDWMWEQRAIYFTELNRLGADIALADPHRVFIKGPTKLRAAQVVCPPALRPSAIILIAMLAAEGTSILRNIYSISRGYEDIVDRLNKVGADIKSLHQP